MVDYNPPPPEEELLDEPPTPSIPHNREAEEAVVGSVLINPDCFIEVSRVLKNGDFYLHSLRFIWQAFEAMGERRAPIDILTVSEELNKIGVLQDIGGFSFLTGLLNSAPSSMHVMEYANIVVKYADRRRGLSFANEMAQKAYDLENDFDLRGQAMAYLQSSKNGGSRKDAKQAASEAIEKMIERPDYCDFGIPNVDAKVGLFKNELNIIAGYPGTGKSALAFHAARWNAKLGKRVGIVSLEMTAAQMWMRVACGDLKVDMNQVRKGLVSEEMRSNVIRKAADLAEAYQGKIIIYEAPMTPQDILGAAMMEKFDLLFIDHLRLISGKPARTMEMVWYGDTESFLRQNVAQAENCCVALLHQLNRSSERESRRPTKHDLKFGGEDDADGVILLYREKDDSSGHITSVDVEFIVDKSRFGWTGTEIAKFNLPEQRFYGTQTRKLDLNSRNGNGKDSDYTDH